MQFSTTTDGGVTVIRCDGRLNMMAAPRLRSVLEEAVEAGQVRLVLDLEPTVFVDSSGLGALVAGLKTARRAGGDLRIAAAGDQVLTVLGLTNLDRVLRPYESVGQASHEW
ncbi:MULTISPECIES: STAS domain-containing protein [unclassified Serinicoccus]|uniref:STAS domain-containing protein n=1 Tax=unclassified Serinicoccus TaxID=2643101 RepID=UPI00385478B2